jgi:hypothetical protein
MDTVLRTLDILDGFYTGIRFGFSDVGLVFLSDFGLLECFFVCLHKDRNNICFSIISSLLIRSSAWLTYLYLGIYPYIYTHFQ